MCVCLGSCIGRMFVSTVFLVPADARRRGQAARVRTGQSEWVGTPVTDHHVAGNFRGVPNMTDRTMDSRVKNIHGGQLFGI